MSRKEKPREIRMAFVEDILLFALAPFWSWIVHKLFDFFWERGKTRLKFEGKTHVSRYLFVKFGDVLLSFMFGWLLGTPEDTKASEFQESAKRFVKVHRRYHQFVGIKLCSACYCIYWNRMWFERFVSDPELARNRSKLFSECVISV